MKPEERTLIHDLLDGEQEARREATLKAGGRILRHRRWKRMAARGSALASIVAIAAVFVHQQTARTHQTPIAAAAPSPSGPVRSLTDDELLALFPNTPVGLATIDGKKRLIFPRAGDEERFVTRL